MLLPSVNRQKAWLFTLLAALVSLNIYFHFSFEGTLRDRANWLDSLFARVLHPAQLAFSWTRGGVVDATSFMHDLYKAREENAQLKSQLHEQQMALQALDEFKNENSRLREMLQFRAIQPIKLIPARVIARDLSLQFRTIEIDRGSEDGLTIDMPVVSVEGVVGRILRTDFSTSEVLLITDVNSRLEAVSQRSRTRVIVGGSPAGDLQLRHLPRRHDVRQGDELVTSGLGGFFPAGFKIGTLVGLAQDPNFVLQQAEVEPAVDFDSLAEVFIAPPPEKVAAATAGPRK